MAWSIFTQGGGKAAALGWAQDFLVALGAPVTQQNLQFVYDWQLAEGGGGKFNPLNQGPVPGQPWLTTTGSQYGGGAADYASYQAGIQGAVAYLNMPYYVGIKNALFQSNYGAARQALIDSPWAASHYGYGSSFPSSGVPSGLVPQTLAGSVAATSGGGGTVSFPTGGLLTVHWDVILGVLGNYAQMVLGAWLIVFGANSIIKDLTGLNPGGQLVDVGVGAATGGKGGAAVAAAPKRVRPAVRKQARARTTASRAPARASRRRVAPSRRLDAAQSATRRPAAAPRKATQGRHRTYEGPNRRPARITPESRERGRVIRERKERVNRHGPPRASQRVRVEDEF